MKKEFINIIKIIILTFIISGIIFTTYFIFKPKDNSTVRFTSDMRASVYLITKYYK